MTFFDFVLFVAHESLMWCYFSPFLFASMVLWFEYLALVKETAQEICPECMAPWSVCFHLKVKIIINSKPIEIFGY